MPVVLEDLVEDVPPESIHAAVEPEAHGAEHGGLHLRWDQWQSVRVLWRPSATGHFRPKPSAEFLLFGNFEWGDVL